MKRFFKTAWRNLLKNKTFSILNITGLAIGIACAGLISLWVEYYVSYNDSIPEVADIYSVQNNQVYGKDRFTFFATPFKLKDATIQQFPEVKNASRFSDESMAVSLGEKHLAKKGGYVDSSFLSMFGIKLLRGQSSTALNQPGQIAVSRKLALAYFGSIDVMDKTLMVEKEPYTIKAVFDDLPENMQFSFDLLLPYDSYYKKYIEYDSWGNNITQTWVQLQPGVRLAAFNQKLAKLSRERNPDATNTFFLYPLKRMALYGDFQNGKETAKGMIVYVRMFSIIALIILLIACVNFMNLSTARSEKRAKEIGLRKVMGSTRGELIGRLMAEAMLISFVAMVFAVLILAAVLPLFNGMVDLHLKLNLFKANHLLFLLCAGLVSGVVAGSYPAFYLSSFNPVRALKKQISKRAGGVSFIRKGLVVLQFSISGIIIIAIMVIYHQIQHTRSRSLGFDKENVLYLPKTPELEKSFPALKQALMNTNQVQSVALGSHTPMGMYSNRGGARWRGASEKNDVLITFVQTDADYLNTLEIGLAAGRGFYSNNTTDSNNIIINETLAKLMGSEGRVGGQIYFGDPSNGAMTIVGIAKNFVYNNISATSPAPLMFFDKPENSSLIFLRLKPTTDLQGTLSNLKTVFGRFDASQPFDYSFMDKDFEQKFKQQRFTGTLSIIFGGLAIIISCLGLFGLSAFMAEQRTKEIGIRKVLGASVRSVVGLLTKDFLGLVLISCVIAFPVAYLLMSKWLNGFEYRISIQWYVFLAAALVCLFIAFLTVSSQAYKAGRINPVKSISSD